MYICKYRLYLLKSFKDCKIALPHVHDSCGEKLHLQIQFKIQTSVKKTATANTYCNKNTSDHEERNNITYASTLRFYCEAVQKLHRKELDSKNYNFINILVCKQIYTKQ